MLLVVVVSVHAALSDIHMSKRAGTNKWGSNCLLGVEVKESIRG